MAFDDGVKTVSGSIAHTDDAAAKVPFVSLKCGIAPTLDGVSSVDVVQTGKNVLDTAISETKTHNSVSITCDGNGKYTATGTATGGSANITFTLKTPCTIKSGMYLHLMNSGASGSVSITLQKQDNTTIYAPALSPANRIADLSSYAGQTIYSIRFYIANGASFEMTLTPMACFSNTATTYEPYQTPTVYNASLGRTIYGGTAEVVNGTGSEAYARIDLGTLNYTLRNGVGMQSNGVSSLIQNPPDNYTKTTAIATDYTADTWQLVMGSGTSSGLFGVSGGYICFATTETDAVTFKASMSGKYLVFPLATPTDFTFTPITPTPETVGKVNNVYCDTGNTELTYYDNAHGFSEIMVNKNGVLQTAYLHKVIYGGQADVVKGTCEPKNLISPPEYTANTPSLCLDLGEDRTFDSVTLSFLATNTVVNANSAAIVDYRKNDGTHQYRTLASFKNENGVDFAKQTSNSGRFRNSYISVSGITFRYVYIYYEYNNFSYISTDSMSEWQLELGSTASEYAPHFEPFTFPPISMETDEGENTLFANEGGSAITYRKDTE